jgi:hypothetical protein
VAEIQSVDATICATTVNVDDLPGLFGEFLLLSQGIAVQICTLYSRLFQEICRELGNSELLAQVAGARITIEDVPDRSSLEIAFIAAHFSEVADDITEIGVLDEVLRHPSLHIQSEDWLFEFLVRSNLFPLFEHVWFDFLSAESMSGFLDLVSPSELNVGRWQGIRRRLVCPVLNIRHFRPDDPLDGVISFLTKRYGGNAVTVTGSSQILQDSKFAPRNAAALGDDSVYDSGGRVNQWLCYDFDGMLIRPTHYTIRSAGYYNLKTWVVEGSTNGSSWVDLDRRYENHDFESDEKIVRTFAVAKSEEVRMVQLRQLYKNHARNFRLVLCGFEIFGTLVGLPV